MNTDKFTFSEPKTSMSADPEIFRQDNPLTEDEQEIINLLGPKSRKKFQDLDNQKYQYIRNIIGQGKFDSLATDSIKKKVENKLNDYYRNKNEPKKTDSKKIIFSNNVNNSSNMSEEKSEEKILKTKAEPLSPDDYRDLIRAKQLAVIEILNKKSYLKFSGEKPKQTKHNFTTYLTPLLVACINELYKTPITKACLVEIALEEFLGEKFIKAVLDKFSILDDSDDEVNSES